MKKDIPYKIVSLCCFFVFFYSCVPTKYLGKDEYLLNRVKIMTDNKEVSVSELRKIVRQKPNTKILGVARFHLGIYNLSGRNGERKFNKWLRRIGEGPVVYDSFLTERSVEQLKLYLNNKGFYSAEVADSVRYYKQRADVVYRIKTGRVTRVGELSFRADTMFSNDIYPLNTPLYQMVMRDTVHSLLHSDMPMDVEVLESERERVTALLRGEGYYNFSKHLIQYYADTVNTDAWKANLSMGIINSLPDSNAYRTYVIGTIRVNMDYDPIMARDSETEVYTKKIYNDYEVLYNRNLKIKPQVILESIQFGRGELYDIRKVAGSYARLQALNLFKFINILFQERTDALGNSYLDCEIQLTPMKRQAYNIFLEGTNNSGNIGVGGNFSYNHKNIFHGGENLRVSVWGALRKEKLKENEIFSTTEVGTELRLVTPQFWLPLFRLEGFRRDYAPKTSISLSYSQERTQFYRRKVASAKFGYLWKHANNKWNYGLDLLDLNYVMMPKVDRAFIDGLKNQYVKSAYTDHMILSANFSAIYKDRAVNSTESSNYFRGNIETSGNFLLGVNKLFGKRHSELDGEHFYKAFGVRYAQFIKVDGEYRFNHYINRANTLVYRLFLGCGFPYGNMKALPFEEAYYCGGANDIRAWHSRTLGPGGYRAEDNYPNSVGDFKLEANLEYRFKLFWLLEGALFADAGNVWNLKNYTNRPDTQFASDFYKQIAVGVGAGMRINITFLLLRFDWGFRMHDPAQLEGKRFVLFDKNNGFRTPVWNIAIGYPF